MGSQVPAERESGSIQALAVALQQPAFAKDQRSICAMLQVSKAWRTATQQSAASLTDVSFNSRHDTPTGINFQLELSRVSKFAGWLAKYPQLISTLKVCPKRTGSVTPGGPHAASTEVVQQLLNRALVADGTRPARQLRLLSYTSTVPATAGLLAALRPATLTSLHLLKQRNSAILDPASHQLTGLRQMTLGMDAMLPGEADKCRLWANISSLLQLTKLELDNISASSDLELLPVQLQQLSIQYIYDFVRTSEPKPDIWKKHGATVRAVANLQHLTCLTQLKLQGFALAEGSSVPSNLRSLEMAAAMPDRPVAGLGSLHQLTSIVLHSNLSTNSMSSDEFESLVQFSQLKHVSLHVWEWPRTMSSAVAWWNLPLCGLEIMSWQVAYVQQLMQRISQATMLTNLSIETSTDALDAPAAHTFTICEHMTALRNLKRLHLAVGASGDFAQQDAEHLSALVSLTSLQLCRFGRGPYLDAATLRLLASHLTNLQRLELNWASSLNSHQMSYSSALPAIARLSMLEALWIGFLPTADAMRALLFLTSLSRLTSLQGFDYAGQQAVQSFWASISEQRKEALNLRSDSTASSYGLEVLPNKLRSDSTASSYGLEVLPNNHVQFNRLLAAVKSWGRIVCRSLTAALALFLCGTRRRQQI